ncbi:LytR/AlgR family response regulator transcription factor [Candidatus Stoquefichus massiliensis]|uniref:LytR/AlgR family response regulator transcription factor n=1 Tax=Candidatus Stoquefichus massiliensis TaxID=1470350 RepID=UPI0004AEB197|nr:LytTR family DNA-binding domain-containing protein [Candidatus Stoquefichus massiliensis]
MVLAVVDDQQEDRKDIVSQVKQYQVEHQLDFEIIEYDNGSDFMNDIHVKSFQIVLLDIYMPLSGIDIAKKLRNENIDCAIIFITVSTEHYPDSYNIGCHHYLVKPIQYDQLCIALDRCKDYLMQSFRYITLPSMEKVYVHDIQYIEVLHNMTTLHALKEYPIYITLNKLLELINDKHIIRIHKSYAIHLKFIQAFKGQTIELKNGTQLTIGRTYAKKFKETYLHYLLEKDL